MRDRLWLGLMAVFVASWVGYAGWTVWQSYELKRDQAEFRRRLQERINVIQGEVDA